MDVALGDRGGRSRLCMFMGMRGWLGQVCDRVEVRVGRGMVRRGGRVDPRGLTWTISVAMGVGMKMRIKRVMGVIANRPCNAL